MNKFVKTNIPASEMIREYLQAINGLIRLTKKELELMTMLVRFDMEYVFADKYEIKDAANTANRKAMMKETGMTKDNLCTYLRNLVKKGVLIKARHGELTVIPELKPVIREDHMVIELLLTADNYEQAS